MKSNEEIEALIVSFLASNASPTDIEEFSLDSNLLAEGILDSMGIMGLIAHLESSLGIKIPSKDLIPSNFMSVQAMIGYLGSISGTSNQ